MKIEFKDHDDLDDLIKELAETLYSEICLGNTSRTKLLGKMLQMLVGGEIVEA